MANGKKQVLLTQIRSDGSIDRPKIRLNAVEIKLPPKMKLFISEIRGDFTQPDIHASHIYRKVNLKFDFACAGFYSRPQSNTSIWVVSVESLQPLSFTDSGVQFRIIPSREQVELDANNPEHAETLRELVFNFVQQAFVNLGYLKPGSVRTSSKRHPKGFMLKVDAPVKSMKNGLYWYHGYDGILLKVKNWQGDHMIIALDTVLPILKTTHPAEAGFQTMIDNNGEWPSTENLPDNISDAFLLMRKKNAKKRLQQDLRLLDQVTFDAINAIKIGDFQSERFEYIEEPKLLFGSNHSEQISKDTELSEFIAPLLMKHGPYNPILTPIRIQPVVMKQVEEEFGLDKIKEGLTGLQEVYRNLYKQDLIVNEIIILKETEDQVEAQCLTLAKKWKTDYDIVVGFLKGKKYNHPFRSALKRGLQNVPSQALKYFIMNSVKMFKDIMSHSILSQINYKATGKLMNPVDPEHLKEFQVRIYYDLGHFRLNFRSAPLGPNPIALVGTAALITDQGIYGFQTASQINDVNQIEVPSRNLVRSIITEVIKKYLHDTGRTMIEGNILLQRDGKAHPDEYDEATDVIEYFRDSANPLISPSCNWVFVEFHKQPVIRLFSHFADLEPRRGTYFPIDETNAFLTNSGYPDIHAKEAKKKQKEEAVGVAVSLEIQRLAEGGPQAIAMKKIAKDVYYRSFMWMASFQKTRYIAEANMVHELFDLRRQGVNNPPDWIC
jgi:hypothetical protein